MKKIALIKSASEFALANYEIKDKVQQAELSLAAFKAGGFDSADFDVWNQAVLQYSRQWAQMATQKLPSEAIAAQKAVKEASTPKPAESASETVQGAPTA